MEWRGQVDEGGIWCRDGRGGNQEQGGGWGEHWVQMGDWSIGDGVTSENVGGYHGQ